VLAEFAGLYHELTERAGVHVNLFQHDVAHGTPDACFPNNWFSTHAAGEALGGVQSDTLVLYPMKCPNRCAWARGAGGGRRLWLGWHGGQRQRSVLGAPGPNCHAALSRRAPCTLCVGRVLADEEAAQARAVTPGLHLHSSSSVLVLLGCRGVLGWRLGMNAGPL
jgi:N,N dimethylarginine dimethylhydrolase, eukaryotic